MIVIRDGSALLARDKDGSFRKEAGARIDSNQRRLLTNKANSRVTARSWKWSKRFKPARVRLRGRGVRRGVADRGVRRRRSSRHPQANNLPMIERSRPSRRVGVNRRVSRKSPAQVGCSVERREHGCREVERRQDWVADVGWKYLGTPQVRARESTNLRNKAIDDSARGRRTRGD